MTKLAMLTAITIGQSLGLTRKLRDGLGWAERSTGSALRLDKSRVRLHEKSSGGTAKSKISTYCTRSVSIVRGSMWVKKETLTWAEVSPRHDHSKRRWDLSLSVSFISSTYTPSTTVRRPLNYCGRMIGRLDMNGWNIINRPRCY